MCMWQVENSRVMQFDAVFPHRRTRACTYAFRFNRKAIPLHVYSYIREQITRHVMFALFANSAAELRLSLSLSLPEQSPFPRAGLELNSRRGREREKRGRACMHL